MVQRHLEDSLNIDQGKIIIIYRSISTIFKVTFQNHVFSKQSLPLTDKKLPTMHFKFFLILQCGIRLMTGNIHSALLCAWQAHNAVDQSLSCVQLFVTPWTAAHQASLSFTMSQSLLKLMSIELVMPSNHLNLCRPLLLLPPIYPSIRVFSQHPGSVLHITWPKYWSFVSAKVVPMSSQGWFPLGLTGWISLLSKGLSRVFSSTTVWKDPFFGTQLSLWSQNMLS